MVFLLYFTKNIPDISLNVTLLKDRDRTHKTNIYIVIVYNIVFIFILISPWVVLRDRSLVFLKKKETTKYCDSNEIYTLLCTCMYNELYNHLDFIIKRPLYHIRITVPVFSAPVSNFLFYLSLFTHP